MFYWLMKNWFVGPIVKAAFRPWIPARVHSDGRRGDPRQQPSFVHRLGVPAPGDRSQISFLAKSDYYTGDRLQRLVHQDLPQSLGDAAHRPFRREGLRIFTATGLGVLATGDVRGIYPQGTRSLDGKLYRGVIGVARTILEATVPVVPVAMIDTTQGDAYRFTLPKV